MGSSVLSGELGVGGGGCRSLVSTRLGVGLWLPVVSVSLRPTWARFSTGDQGRPETTCIS